MVTLTDSQRKALRDFLITRGLSFKPLQDEMVDHFSCDLEEHMSDGRSFEEAWQLSMAGIPHDHLRTIQTKIMQTIDKRFTISRGLSFLALALLFIGTAFKVLHFPFAGEALIVSFAVISASLIIAAVTGISVTREKKGAVRLLAVICGMILMISGYGFRLLHLPGADTLVLLAVSVILLSLLLNTVYVYRNASGKSNLLTFLHEKYTPGIERFLLILLIPLTVYKAVSVLIGSVSYVGNMALLVVIFGAGLQFIALVWRAMENALHRDSIAFAAALVSSVCLCLPFLGPLLPLQQRIITFVVFTSVSAWLAFRAEQKPVAILPLVTFCVAPVLSLGWSLLRLGVLPPGAEGLIFNLLILALLLFGLLMSKPHGTIRAYMLVSLAFYVFEYVS